MTFPLRRAKSRFAPLFEKLLATKPRKRRRARKCQASVLEPRVLLAADLLPVAAIVEAEGESDGAPVLVNPIAYQTTPDSQAYSFAIPVGTFFDPDGDSLQVTASGLPPWLSYNASQRLFSGTPSVQNIGTKTVTVTASDSVNSVATTFNVNVYDANVAPVVAGSLDFRVLGPTDRFTLTVPENTFFDANGDALRIQASGVPGWMWFNEQTNTFNGRPGFPNAGTTRTITLTASDGRASAQTTFNVHVTPRNEAPRANQRLNVEVARLNQSWLMEIPESAFFDPDGDDLLLTAQHPSWMFFDSERGTFSGVPNNTVAGTTRTVSIFASDGYETAMTTFNVYVPIANDGPQVANRIGNQTVAATSQFDLMIPNNTFSDADGDTLTVSAKGFPSWMSFDPSSRTFTGVPGAANAGTTRTVTISAADARESVVTTFNVYVPPTADGGGTVVNAIPTQTVVTYEPFVFQVPGDTFADFDSAVTYGATGLPSWLTFNPGNRFFSGTAPFSAIGTRTVTVTASNATQSASALFNVSVQAAPNDAPVLSVPIPNRQARVGEGFSYTLPANTFRDPDGDSLRVTVGPLPGWMNYDAATRVFSGTPTAGEANRVRTISVSAADSRESVSTTFEVSIQPAPNAKPVVNASIPSQEARAGEAFRYTIPNDAFRDPEGRPLSLAVSGNPNWLSYNAGSRTLSGTPQDANVGNRPTVKVTATDDQGATASQNFIVTVVEAPQAVQSRRVTLVGDSVTIGYAEFTEDSLEELGSYELTEHVGVGGATSESYLARGFHQKALAKDPDVIVLMMGTNDAAFLHVNGEDWFEDYTTSMSSMIDQFTQARNSRNAQPTLFLATSIPIIQPYWNYEVANDAVDQMNAWLRNEAQRRSLPLIDVNNALSSQPNWQSYYSDGLHLQARNKAGYDWVAGYVAGQIDEQSG